jgi:hypothetical protein
MLVYGKSMIAVRDVDTQRGEAPCGERTTAATEDKDFNAFTVVSIGHA